MEVGIYTKKPVDVEAIQWDGTSPEMYRILAWILENGNRASVRDGYPSQGPDTLLVETSGGYKSVVKGEWVIKEANGMFSVCQHEIFEKTFQLKYDFS
jgi:hypothetical protein